MGRIRRGQILDPQCERLMAHFDRQDQHLIQREEHRDLQEDRQAARERIDPFGLVQRHDFLLLLGLVVLVAVLDRLHLGLDRLHRRHAGELFLGNREHHRAHDQGQQHDRHAKVADCIEQPLEQSEDRLFKPAEPAPVNCQAKVGNAGCFIGIQHAGFLGPGEQLGYAAGLLARSNRGLRIEQVGDENALAKAAEIAAGPGLFRDQGAHPIDIGKADPGRVCRIRDGHCLGHIAVIVAERNHAIKGPKRAGVDIETVERGGLVGPVELRHRFNRDRGGPGIADALTDGQHIVCIDRIGQRKGLPTTVVPA